MMTHGSKRQSFAGEGRATFANVNALLQHSVVVMFCGELLCLLVMSNVAC